MEFLRFEESKEQQWKIFDNLQNVVAKVEILDNIVYNKATLGPVKW